MGHDLETLLEPVDDGDEVAVVEGEVGVVAREGGDVVPAGGVHAGDGVAERLLQVEDVVAEARPQPRGDVSDRQRAR